MATKTGAELKLSILGDAQELINATEYTMNVVNIRFGVTFNYTISDPVEPDTGERQIGRVVTLTPAEMAAGLTLEQRQALQDLIASKI